MIFLYLLIIAVLGIGILLFLEHKKTKKGLLQIIKRSCSIDSIQFEKRLDRTKIVSNTFKKNTYLLILTNFKKILRYFELRINTLKSGIRKKLHSDTQAEKPSEFIIKIKTD